MHQKHSGEHLPAVRLFVWLFLFSGAFHPARKRRFTSLHIIMWNYIWPICMVVLANVGYNIVTKSTPSEANALLSLTVTYLTAALFSFILYWILGRGQTLSIEFSRLNWTSFALGICIIALEFGYIYVYRAGWKVNTASLTANIALACILVIVGFLLYKEVLSLRQIMGIGVCIAGLVLISG